MSASLSFQFASAYFLVCDELIFDEHVFPISSGRLLWFSTTILSDFYSNSCDGAPDILSPLLDCAFPASSIGGFFFTDVIKIPVRLSVSLISGRLFSPEFTTAVPISHIGKFDLEKTFSLDFGVKCNFSKFELSMSCSNFSRQLKTSEV